MKTDSSTKKLLVWLCCMVLQLCFPASRKVVQKRAEIYPHSNDRYMYAFDCVAAGHFGRKLVCNYDVIAGYLRDELHRSCCVRCTSS